MSKLESQSRRVLAFARWLCVSAVAPSVSVEFVLVAACQTDCAARPTVAASRFTCCPSTLSQTAETLETSLSPCSDLPAAVKRFEFIHFLPKYKFLYSAKFGRSF